MATEIDPMPPGAATHVSDDTVRHSDQTSVKQALHLDSAHLQQLREDAFKKARSHYAKKASAVTENLKDIQAAAAEVAHSSDHNERWSKLKALLRTAVTGEPARILARILICAYYVNVVYDEVETWLHLRQTQQGASATMRPHRPFDPEPPPARFPYAYVFGLLPAAIMTAVGVWPWLFASVLLVFTVWQDALLTWAQIKNVIAYGSRPTELVMKQLAMVSAAAVTMT